MRIVISSKYLASKLKEFDFGNNSIMSCTKIENQIVLYYNTGSISINVQSCSLKKIVAFIQENKRWDWLYQIVSKIEDTPVILEIDHYKLNLIIEF